MILEKYQEVNVLLTTLLQYRQKLRTDFFSVYDPLLFNLKKTEYALCLLKRTVNTFNDLFGWPIFFIILHTTFQIMNHVSYAIFNTTGFHLLVVVAVSLSLTLVSCFGGILSKLLVRFAGYDSNCDFHVRSGGTRGREDCTAYVPVKVVL
jgi:hypothetical protein